MSKLEFLTKSEQPSSFQGARSISILSIRIYYSWSLLLDGSASLVKRPLTSRKKTSNWECDPPGEGLSPVKRWVPFPKSFSRACLSFIQNFDGTKCERPGKFVLPHPLWTRASEYSILLSGGLGEDKGYRATRLFVSSSTET